MPGTRWMHHVPLPGRGTADRIDKPDGARTHRGRRSKSPVRGYQAGKSCAAYPSPRHLMHFYDYLTHYHVWLCTRTVTKLRFNRTSLGTSSSSWTTIGT